MDGLRGHFGSHDDAGPLGHDADGHGMGSDVASQLTGMGVVRAEDGRPPQKPLPSPLVSDERRMQVRAYNFWAGMLGNSSLPSVEDLEPAQIADFAPYSVLLDFSAGSHDPAVSFIGEELAGECSVFGEIATLAEVPRRSLLHRISDNYLQILANRAPIGFEAEFLNQSGVTIRYRGVLLPFSSDGNRIDYVYGVINWKVASDDSDAGDALELQIEQALEPIAKLPREDVPLTEWADGPVETHSADGSHGKGRLPSFDIEDFEPLEPGPLKLTIDPGKLLDPADVLELDPAAILDAERALSDSIPVEDRIADIRNAHEEPASLDPVDQPLGHCLAAARELAQAAHGSEDRSRQALYAAVGRAHDFALAAEAEPEAFRALVEEAGLPFQERAPLTPLVKLVFGADHDKTRLAEYSAAIAYALRTGIARGGFAAYLSGVSGGLKAVVREERNLRRKPEGPVKAKKPKPRVTRALRQIEGRPLAEISGQGEEFTVLVARRMETGDVVLVGEVADDPALLERAARHLIG